MLSKYIQTLVGRGPPGREYRGIKLMEKLLVLSLPSDCQILSFYGKSYNCSDILWYAKLVSSLLLAVQVT